MINIYIILLIMCIIFIELFIHMKLYNNIISIMELSKESMSVLLSSNMHDDEKEKHIRNGSIKIFQATLYFIFKLIFISLVLFLIYFIATNYFSIPKVILISNMSSITNLILLTGISAIYICIRNVIFR